MQGLGNGIHAQSIMRNHFSDTRAKRGQTQTVPDRSEKARATNRAGLLE